MEQKQYLIDTNALIDYLGNKLPALGKDFMNDIIDTGPNISIISKIEVLSFNATEKDHQILTQFIQDSIVLDLTNSVVDISIAIRKNNKTKLPDAIIAATSLANNYVLIKRNVSDFKNIAGLQVINPHNLG